MLLCPTCGRRYADDVRVCTEDGAALQNDASVPPDTPADPLVGRTLDGKYRIEGRLGEGGMGAVYRATELLIDRPVAIKVLKPRFVTNEAAQERFRREARAAGRLHHPNAVTVTDFGRTSDGVFYIVMELLEGHSLRHVLAQEAPLDTARAVSLMLQISAAVAAAHKSGIIHRDLKPGNIFVVRRKSAPPTVKVLDFGIAKLADDAGNGAGRKSLTLPGARIGTPRYMSPEQFKGEELSPASDVYGLGVILYEMLTGTTPFTGATPLEVALKQSIEPPRPPREFVAGIPAALEEVVLHALEREPGDRSPDAGAFRLELYATAELLGLEHAEGGSAPTIEALRSAGTESPSGRLVVDIERVRQQRAASTSGETVIPLETGAERVRQKIGSTSPAGASDPGERPTPAPVKGESSDSRQIGPYQVSRSLVVLGLILAALLLIIIVVTSKSSGAPAP